MIVAINYANSKYRNTQKFNSKTALKKAKVDKVISYSIKDIDADFVERNRKILSNKRGNGYWLWKPYIILKTLQKIDLGDYLVYLDSGAFYINNVKYLIRQMKKDNQYIMTFELPFKESMYTKRDVFVHMNCDEKKYTDTNQRMGTFIIIKKTEEAVLFVKEWLKYCEEESIITDSPNHLGKDNYEDFIDNRHDQSIFSVLSKKYGINTYPEPSQFGRYPEVFWRRPINKVIKFTKYPQIIAEHRRPFVDKSILWEQLFFAYAPKLFIEFYFEFCDSNFRGRETEKIAILTDNMPIKEEEYGIGMCKVVNRLIFALNKNIETIICTDKNYSKRKIDKRLSSKICLINNFHNIKMPLLSNIMFLINVSKKIKDLKNRQIKKIFIPLGADYRELERAYLIAQYYKMQVSIYVVDDFYDYQNKILKQEKIKLKKKIEKYLKAMKTVFVISRGMKEYVYDNYKCKSVLLPLPYENKKNNTQDNCVKEQIMFLGGINELYIGGLKDIAEVIDEINVEYNKEIKLRFTYKSAFDVKSILGNYKCIVSNQIKTEELLQEEMYKSLFCFMPFSDEKGFYNMQNTSFPSKLVEYLSSARSIVIYGNKNNTAKRYFAEHELPFVIGEKNKELLKECILNHLNNRIDNSVQYKKVVRKEHAFENIYKRVIYAL